jgi:hypothetical protein
MASAAQTPEPRQPVESVQPVESDQPDQSDLPASTLTPPSPDDDRRYCANRAGLSIAQIAKDQQVSEEEVIASINRVRLDNERYSSGAAGVAARRLLFHALPRIQSAVDEALGATKFHGKKVVMVDKETGEQVTMEDVITIPDHDIRLRTIDSVRSFFAVVQPRDPAVQIVSNSQTNILNQGQQPAQLGPGAPTSPEAVIRQIVAARQNMLTAGTEPATIEAKKEDSPMPRVRANDLEEEEGELIEETEDEETEDDEDGEDEDDDDELVEDEEEE